VEVAIAFGDLRPELAGDFTTGFTLVRSTSIEFIFVARRMDASR